MSTDKYTESENILDKVSIGRRLREERVRLDLNQADLATLLKHPKVTTAAAISRYEKGQIPEPSILARYAEVTGKSEQYFLRGDEESDEGSGRRRESKARSATKADRLDMTNRRLRAQLDELIDSNDPEIIGHLKRQLKLLKDLKDRRTKS